MEARLNGIHFPSKPGTGASMVRRDIGAGAAGTGLRSPGEHWECARGGRQKAPLTADAPLTRSGQGRTHRLPATGSPEILLDTEQFEAGVMTMNWAFRFVGR